MSTRQTGATYLITIEKSLFALNSPESDTSSMIVWGLIKKPTKMLVASATMGMITLLLAKSKKSSICKPIIFTLSHAL